MGRGEARQRCWDLGVPAREEGWRAGERKRSPETCQKASDIWYMDCGMWLYKS